MKNVILLNGKPFGNFQITEEAEHNRKKNRRSNTRRCERAKEIETMTKLPFLSRFNDLAQFKLSVRIFHQSHLAGRTILCPNRLPKNPLDFYGKENTYQCCAVCVFRKLSLSLSIILPFAHHIITYAMLDDTKHNSFYDKYIVCLSQ